MKGNDDDAARISRSCDPLYMVMRREAVFVAVLASAILWNNVDRQLYGPGTASIVFLAVLLIADCVMRRNASSSATRSRPADMIDARVSTECGCFLIENYWSSILERHVTFTNPEDFKKKYMEDLAELCCKREHQGMLKDGTDVREGVINELLDERRRRLFYRRERERRKIFIQQHYIKKNRMLWTIFNDCKDGNELALSTLYASRLGWIPSIWKIIGSADDNVKLVFRDDAIPIIRAISSGIQSIEQLKEEVGELIHEQPRGVFTFPLLSDAFCDMFVDELRNFRKTCQARLPSKGRVNSMHHNGIDLEELDLYHGFLDPLIGLFIRKLAKMCYPKDNWCLDDHKSFTVTYDGEERADKQSSMEELRDTHLQYVSKITTQCQYK